METEEKNKRLVEMLNQNIYNTFLQKVSLGSKAKTGLKLPEDTKDWFKSLIRIFEKMFK